MLEWWLFGIFVCFCHRNIILQWYQACNSFHQVVVSPPPPPQKRAYMYFALPIYICVFWKADLIQSDKHTVP